MSACLRFGIATALSRNGIIGSRTMAVSVKSSEIMANLRFPSRQRKADWPMHLPRMRSCGVKKR